MASSQLRISPPSLPKNSIHKPRRIISSLLKTPSISLLRSSNLNLSHPPLTTPSNNNDDNGNGGGFGKGGGGGGDGGNDNFNNNNNDNNNRRRNNNPIALFIEGWRSRVAADPEFPFKVLMEELVGVSATALGDMATRPNFGLDQLDFVLSTIIVGSIVNFTLMYLLAPTLTASASSSSLPSYIFEPGPYSVAARSATFIFKGFIFAAVGFASGLAGTAISNGLVALREGKGGIDKNEKKKKKGPKTVLNAATWAVHMGVSSNLRYQTLNGVEFLMAKAMPAGLFKMVVVVLRCLNNVAGGMSFVMLGRLMGSQKAEEEQVVAVDAVKLD